MPTLSAPMADITAYDLAMAALCHGKRAVYTQGMGLQLFGTRKCPETRKAERFLKERGIKYQFIDLSGEGAGGKGPISQGELRAIASALGADALIDAKSPRFADKGLGYMDFDPEEEILKDPLLLRTPVLRDGRKAVIGYAPELWKAIIAK
jgi:arsenate reductase (glutaredoxin)